MNQYDFGSAILETTDRNRSLPNFTRNAEFAQPLDCPSHCRLQVWPREPQSCRYLALAVTLNHLAKPFIKCHRLSHSARRQVAICQSICRRRPLTLVGSQLVPEPA